MSESSLQSEIIKYLKDKGCYVIKTRPGVGIPDGCPDIIFLYEGFWGGAEIKANAKVSFQPLQKETVNMLNRWSWCKVIYPENWENIRIELNNMLS